MTSSCFGFGTSSLFTFQSKNLIFVRLLFFLISILLNSFCSDVFGIIQEKWQVDRDSLQPPVSYYFAGIIGSILFSLIADKTKKHRYVLIICIAGYTIFSLALLLPSHIKITSIGDPHFYFPLLQTINYFFAPAIYAILNAIAMSEVVDRNLFGQNSITELLGHVYMIKLFKNLKLMKFSNQAISHIYALILLISAALIIFILNSFKSRIESVTTEDLGENEEEDDKNEKFSMSAPAMLLVESKPSIWKKLLSFKLLIFLLAFLITGFNFSFVEKFFVSFSKLFINDEGSTINHLSMIIFCSIAIVMFDILVHVFYKQIYQMLGIKGFFNLGIFLLMIRNFAYYFLNLNEKNNGMIISMIEVARGLGKVLFILSISRVASEFSNNTYAATMQSIFNITAMIIPEAVENLLVPQSLNHEIIISVQSVLAGLGGLMIFWIISVERKTK